MYVRVSDASKHYNLSINTIRKYVDNGLLESKRTEGGHRLVRIDKQPIVSELEDTHTGKSYVYVRVSSYKQRDDLERQRAFMSEKFPEHKIITDIGSGLNWKRKGLRFLLEQSKLGNVQQVVVSNRDRLCRFGFELLEWLFESNETELVVLEQTTLEPDKTFVQDILAIIHVFSCRQNGKRRYKTTVSSKEDKVTIDISTKTGI